MHSFNRSRNCAVLTAAIFLAAVSPMKAEVLVFASGRTLSVKDYLVSGDTITVTFRNGGDATFLKSVVARIDPDEVPADAEVAASAITVAVPMRPSLESRPFATLIESVAAEHGIDPALVHAVVEAESNYRSTATSQVGARGLMQVMPSTARDLGVRSARMLFEPQANLEAGVKYLEAAARPVQRRPLERLGRIQRRARGGSQIRRHPPVPGDPGLREKSAGEVPEVADAR